MPDNEEILASEKSSPRTSVFKEVDDVPRLWERESQSAYTGKKTLARCSDGGKEYSVNSIACSHNEKAVDIGRQPMPVDYGHKMPERYRGKGFAHGDNRFIPLSGNNNTWVPPYEQRKKICGLGRKVFWILVGIVGFLVVSGAIAAGLAAVASSRSSTSSSSIANPAPYEPSTQTSLASKTSTMTMPNRSLVLTTEVATSVQTMTPQATSTSQSPVSPSTMSASSTPTSATTPVASSASPANPAATSGISPEPKSPSTVPATPTTTTATPTSLASSQASSPQIL